jgi:DUF438 domain-containing protein
MPADAQPSVWSDATIGLFRLDTGQLEPEVIIVMLKHLPVNMAFVGPNDRVSYFLQTEERIFPRSAATIGREVAKCHPPKCVYVVEEIIDRFKSGECDKAEFWLELGGRFIHIRYFAVREKGCYMDCLEVGQTLSAIRALEGQQRLLDWN